MNKILRPHHVALHVAELDRSIAFYQGLLGFELVFAWNPQAAYIGELVGHPDVDLHAAILRAPDSDVMLELLEYRAVERRPVDPSRADPGTAHLAFYVDDVDGLYADLRAHGVGSVSAPVTPTIGPNIGGRVVYMLDPDGIRVELIETRRSFAEYATMAGSPR